MVVIIIIGNQLLERKRVTVCLRTKPLKLELILCPMKHIVKMSILISIIVLSLWLHETHPQTSQESRGKIVLFFDVGAITTICSLTALMKRNKRA
ncbi:hypothetical protein KEJ24_07995 [Candidatus Bathyarchaeota archaeon]|nr:hypothetical protein [Candidatus Bathyarchaeota archaeon]